MRDAEYKTLGDCRWDEEPFCFHCGMFMDERTPIDVQDKYIIAKCLNCGCMTPFERTFSELRQM